MTIFVETILDDNPVSPDKFPLFFKVIDAGSKAGYAEQPEGIQAGD